MTDTLRFRACKVNKQQSSGGYKIDGNVPAVSGERWGGLEGTGPRLYKRWIALSIGEIVTNSKSIWDTYPLEIDLVDSFIYLLNNWGQVKRRIPELSLKIDYR